MHHTHFAVNGLFLKCGGFWGLRIFFFYYIISVSKHVFSGSPELRPNQNWLYFQHCSRRLLVRVTHHKRPGTQVGQTSVSRSSSLVADVNLASAFAFTRKHVVWCRCNRSCYHTGTANSIFVHAPDKEIHHATMHTSAGMQMKKRGLGNLIPAFTANLEFRRNKRLPVDGCDFAIFIAAEIDSRLSTAEKLFVWPTKLPSPKKFVKDEQALI